MTAKKKQGFPSFISVVAFNGAKHICVHAKQACVIYERKLSANARHYQARNDFQFRVNGNLDITFDLLTKSGILSILFC